MVRFEIGISISLFFLFSEPRLIEESKKIKRKKSINNILINFN
jgi:hypothetical protein